MKLILIFFFILSFLFTGFSQAPPIQWQKNLGGSNDDVPYQIQPTKDGGSIVIGRSQSSDGDVTINKGDFDYWIVKLNSFGNIEWQKTYGGSGKDIGQAVQQTSDGGYIIAGYTYSNDGDVTGNHGGADYWILKVNSVGVIQWQKTYGGSGIEVVSAVKQTLDGGYVVTGYATSNDGDVSSNQGGYDAWIIKISSSGVLQWQKVLGGSNDDTFNSVQLTNDGGYILAGWTNSSNGDIANNFGSYDAWLIKLNSLGNVEWQKTYGGGGSDTFYWVIQTRDGGFISVGTSSYVSGDVTTNQGDEDYWVVKTNSLGVIEWQKSYGGSGYEEAHSIEQTLEGGYIVTGYCNSSNGDVTGNHGGYDYWTLKLTNSGVIEWQKSLGGTGDDIGLRLFQTVDTGYVVVGISNSTNGDIKKNKGQNDIWIVKLHVCAENIVFKLGNDTTLCAGQTLFLKPKIDNAMFVWQDGSIDSVYSVTKAGTYAVNIMRYGCNTRDSLKVISINPPNINLGADTVLCFAQKKTLIVAADSATYKWQDGSTTPSYDVTKAGTYSVSVKNFCGVAIGTIKIDFNNPPSVNLGADTSFCSGQKKILNAFNTGATYTWQDGSTSPTFEITKSGAFAVQVKNFCGIARGTLNVNVLNPPNINLGADTTFCLGQKKILTVKADSAIYKWQDGSLTPSYEITKAGTYSVSVKNICGAAFGTINIGVVNLPTVKLGNDTTFCTGQKKLLNALFDSATYKWQDGSSNPTFEITKTGTYSVSVTNSCGTVRDSLKATVISLPVVNLGLDTTLCNGKTKILDVKSDGVTYKWQDGSTAYYFVIQKTGVYSVEVKNGCGTAKVSIQATYLDCHKVFIPNVFSPNGDAQNDNWQIFGGFDVDKIVSLKVFSRWGELMYQSDNATINSPYTQWWDGKNAVNGVYAYILTVSYNDGEVETFKGDVTIIR